ncbi:MAG: hypothetical protein ACK5X3_11210, partial [Pseudomonadota bacterium]
MSIVIYTNGNISINGADTGLSVSQTNDGTLLFKVANGEAVQLPRNRYALSCSNPASGVPGRVEFE